MLKKVLITTALLLCFAQIADAQWNRGYVPHIVSIVDLNGRPVTDINEVYIYLPDTTTTQTIYLDRDLTQAITIPMTNASTNTGLTQSTGTIKWWGQDSYDFQIGNDTVTASNAYTNAMSSNQGEIVFPYFLRTYDSQALLDAQSITFGTDLDWVVNGGTTGDLLTFTPKANGAVFQIGNSGGTLDADFRVYTGSGVGLLIDEGTNVFGITGLTTNINVASNYDTNINTSTSTGAVTIGSSTSGAFAVDTTSTAAINADDSFTLTVTAGTVGVAATGGDITIDSTDKSVIIRGTEEAADAILIEADGTAGGVQINSGTGDITLDSGDDIFLEADTGTGDVISLINTQGTAEGATIIRSVAGGIDIDFATAKNMSVTGGQFIFTSNEDVASAFSVITNTGTSETITLVNTQGTGTGAITLTTTAAGDIDINAGDDMTVDTADDITVTVGGDATFAVTGATVFSTGPVTATKGLQSLSISVTATPTGLTTGLIPDGAAFVTVTPTSDANDVVVLPTWVIGNVIRITVPTVGCELETLASSNDTINGVDCDGTNQMAMVAGSVYELVCVADSTWIAYAWGSDGAAQATIVPDAD